jgi:hypothetical protein
MAKPKGEHGGKRRGSGAKKGSAWARTLEKQAAHNLYRQEVLDRMGPLVRAQVEAALGQFATCAVVEMGKNGPQLRRVESEQELEALLASGRAARVALVEPDLQMSRYLTDQVVGKATESVEVSGPSGGPMSYTWITDNFAIPAPVTAGSSFPASPPLHPTDHQRR